MGPNERCVLACIWHKENEEGREGIRGTSGMRLRMEGGEENISNRYGGRTGDEAKSEEGNLEREAEIFFGGCVLSANQRGKFF